MAQCHKQDQTLRGCMLIVNTSDMLLVSTSGMSLSWSCFFFKKVVVFFGCLTLAAKEVM